MNERLNLQDLIDLLAKKKEITKKDAETFLRELVAVISENIESNEPVKIKDFGTFKLVKVNPRRSVDVNTGEAIEIAAHYKLSFTPEKSLKEAINRPFAHFESVILEDGVSFEDVEKTEEAVIDDDNAEDTDDTDTTEEIKVENEPLAIYQAIEEIESEKEESKAERPTPVQEETEITSELQEESKEPEAELNPDEEPRERITEESITQREEETQISPEKEAETEVADALQERNRRKRRRRLITLGSFIFIIIAAFAVCALFFQEIAQYLTDGPADREPKELVEKAGEPKKENTLIPDSLAANKVDSVKSTTTQQEEKADINKPIGAAIIKRGDTMRNIALEHYGHKSFWIYIYEENKDKIKNPNNVPPWHKASPSIAS